MVKRNIVVIGASAGGFDELKKLAANLSANLDAAIFIVWYISPDIRGILPQVLDKLGPLPANHAIDKEPIRMGNIYVAPPDHTCPECHGVLASLQEGDCVRFRCHSGHAFSDDSLLTAITENIEGSLWAAIRSVQESVFFLNHMGDHFAEQNQPKLAAMYFRKAREAEQRAGIIRKSVFNHEQLSTLSVEQQARE